MSIEKGNKLNHLLMNGNPGGLYFSAWLKENGYSDQLIKRYRDFGLAYCLDQRCYVSYRR